MRDSKLFEALNTFSSKDFRRFEAFVSSSFFNKNERAVRLYKYIRKELKKGKGKGDGKGKGLEKVTVYKFLFHSKKYDPQKLRVEMSFLYKLVEEYFVQCSLESSLNSYNTLLLRELFRRDLFKAYQQVLQKENNRIEKAVLRDRTFYEYRFLLHEFEYSLHTLLQSRKVESNLQELVNSIDYNYLLTKLKYACVVLNRESLLAVSYQHNLMAEVLAFLENNQLDDVPLVALYHSLYLLLKEGVSEEHYRETKYLLEHYWKLMHLEDAKDIYITLFNYCNKQLKAGKGEYLREIFDLLKAMLEKELVITDGFIHPYQFYRNAVMAALRLGELKWAESFISSHRLLLREEHRENLFQYCTAALMFYQKNYAGTLSHLLSFEFEDTYNYIEHKVLLAKTLFELEEWDSLLALIHTLKTYLGRKQTLPSHIKKAYSEFCRFLAMLVKSTLDTKKKDSVVDKIENAASLAEKEWLLTKATG